MQNTARSIEALPKLHNASKRMQVRVIPNLYNAHQRIQVSKGLAPAELDFFKKNPLSETWRTQVSQDVVDFVDKIEGRDSKGNPQNELLPSEKTRIFRNPAQYFSRPHNVPDGARNQIYFPNFNITLLRTPHLGPYYAQFEVPLWFSKLDLRSYLKNLYNVDVNHIRSYVVHHKPDRKPPANKYQRGQRFQPSFTKKMTVQLIEPFIWPAESKENDLNNDDHQKDKYWQSTKAGYDDMKSKQDEFVSEPAEKQRTSIAQQAKALLAGKATWQPTWRELPQDVRVLQSRSKAAILPLSTADSRSPSSFR